MAIHLPFLKALTKHLQSGNQGAELYVSPALVLSICAALLFLHLLFWPTQFIINVIVLFILSPFWLPFVLGRFWIFSSVKSRRAKNIKDGQTVLLEIRLPKEVSVDPSVMETFFTSMHIGPGESTWYKKYYKGTARPWFSFEIASFGGVIRFFVWTRTPLRNALENFLYAHFPGVEVIETEDYSLLRDPSTDDFKISAFEFNKSKPVAIPIKPLTKHVGGKSDPLVQLLEFMSSLPEGEELWLQYVCRVSKGEFFRDSGSDWSKEAKKIIKDMKKEVSGYGSNTSADATRFEAELIEATEHNASLLPYDVGVRVIYSCPKEQSLTNGMVVPNMFKSFENGKYNKLGLLPVLGNKTQGFPWEDPKGVREKKEYVRGVEMYRRRLFFHPPYRGEWTLMSAGELATLYHFPRQKPRNNSVQVRERSFKAPPDNLPV